MKPETTAVRRACEIILHNRAIAKGQLAEMLKAEGLNLARSVLQSTYYDTRIVANIMEQEMGWTPPQHARSEEPGTRGKPGTNIYWLRKWVIHDRDISDGEIVARWAKMRLPVRTSSSWQRLFCLMVVDLAEKGGWTQPNPKH
jgi:hypothetical protein